MGLHIAIILDGNRRFAKARRFQPWKGHEEGVKTVENLLRWCKEIGNIKLLTLYVFSLENFSRKKEEIEYLFTLFGREIDRFSSENHLAENRVKFNFIGRIALFPGSIREKINRLESESRDYKDFVCNIAMGYGGRGEIVDAAKKIAEEVASGKLKPEQIDEDLFSKHLYMSEEPDILIRTGKERRISNFLLWQSNYSELFFVDKFWPEFTKADLLAVLEEFRDRERRFGK